VFTLLMSANYGVLGVAFVVAGPVTDAIGPRWAYALGAGAIALATGLAWLFTRNVETAPHPAAA
jgi:hypothetical protein